MFWKRFWFLSLCFLVTAMLAGTLYPFNFFPPNGARRLPASDPGIYFNGHGIAYTGKDGAVSDISTVTVALWLKERFGSKNWGPREIFSFYDGAASPPLLVGQWGGRIFLYSRFETDENENWYRRFRTPARFPQGKPHLVTVTFGAGEKAIYIDGDIMAREETAIRSEAEVKFAGRFMMGNSPKARQGGWWGEIRGVAVYDRLLTGEEIASHGRAVFQDGMSRLAETPGCVACYGFDRTEGNRVESMVGESRPVFVPAFRNALFRTLWDLPHQDMRIETPPVGDFLNNILFFVPFGVVFFTLIHRTDAMGLRLAFPVTALAGGVLSLGIEALQLFLPTRDPGIADVLGNTLGSGAGALIACFLKLRHSA